MRTIRLPVTGLEGRRFHLNTPPWLDIEKTDADYVEDLVWRRETDAMRLGIAFEDALFGKETRGYVFEGNVAWNRPAALQVPIKWRCPLLTLGVEVILSGRLDAIDGDIVVDVKATKKPIDPDKYLDSWQWRCYLLMTGYRRFRYDVFRLFESRRDPGCYTVGEHYDLECQAYPDMLDEVRSALTEWVSALLLLESKDLIVLSDRRGPKAGRAYRAPGSEVETEKAPF